MKFYVVALFAFLAVASATEVETEAESQMTFMNTLKADIAALMEKGATIQSVLNLLDDLVKHEKDDLKNLIHKWEKVQQPRFLATIAKAQKAVDDKKEECATIKKFIESQETEVKKYELNIARAEAKIKANLKSVTKREASRCKNNLLFLDKVREARQVRHFLVYLVKHMSSKKFADSVATNAHAFLTLREIALNQDEGSIADLFQIHVISLFEAEEETHPQGGYTQEQLDKMFNVHKRTAKEIGNGYKDNSKKALTLDDYKYSKESATDYVHGVIKFIRVIISEIDANIKKLRESEEAAVGAFQKFQTTIELENVSLHIYIKQAHEFIIKLKEDIAANTIVWKKCLTEIPPLAEILKAHQKAYKDAHDAYVTRRKNLETVVIPTLIEAKKAYIKKVEETAGKKYANRVADYAADKKFDKTHFENRKKFTYEKAKVSL